MIYNDHLYTGQKTSTVALPMTDPNGAGIYGVPWIPSIYPIYVSINIPAPAGSVICFFKPPRHMTPSRRLAPARVLATMLPFGGPVNSPTW